MSDSGLLRSVPMLMRAPRPDAGPPLGVLLLALLGVVLAVADFWLVVHGAV